MNKINFEEIRNANIKEYVYGNFAAYPINDLR